MALLSALATEIAIPVCAVVGLTYSYSLVQWLLNSRHSDSLHEEEQGRLNQDSGVEERCAKIKSDVYKGVKYFLFMEYQYVGVFMVAFAILVFLILGSVESFSTQSRPCTFDLSNMCKPALATAVFSTVSFLLGAFTSALSGFLGMKIAIYANARTALEERNGVGRTSIAAFRSGAVMGFLIAANGLLMLYLAINLFNWYYGDDWEGLFEAITGYGLGGSSMALFGRASGGILAKAADVCIHLVAKIESNIPQDRNPAVIPNYVGDIVGDIAGMETDLFGSYAGSCCTALVVASISSFGINHDFTAMCYPLLISSMGILVCLITNLFTANFFEITEVKEIKPALKMQIIISTILMTVGIAIISWIALPSSFTIYNFGSQKVVKNWQLFLCVGVGLWVGPVMGFITKCYTDNAFSRVQGATDNVSFGLAFVNILIFSAISILVSFSFAAMYGIAGAALGMLSTFATRLAVSAYGPISDNAKAIAQMARGRVLDDAGNTRAVIGKGFAIESAALVSISLFGAFVSRAAISPFDLLTLKFFVGLMLGAMLPDCFSAITMKSVGRAGLKMVQEVCYQWNKNTNLKGGFEDPDYAKCIKISIDTSSIRGLIVAGALVMLTPLIVGTFFGEEMLSGVLAGSLGSVVWIAISESSTGGAWNNAKYVTAGVSEYARTIDPTTDPAIDPLRWDLLREAADTGDVIGNQWKDASGPPLNILIQLMAVESLVFAPFFAAHGGLIFKIF